MRLVHHRHDPTPTTDRLVAGDPFHLQSLEGCRHVILGHVICWGCFRKIVEHVLRQPIRKVLRHVAEVVGVGAGLASLAGDAVVRICAGHVCWAVQIEDFIPERGTVRCVARGAGGDCKDLVGPRLIERDFGFDHLCIRAGFRVLANNGSRIIQPSTIAQTTKLETWRKAPERTEFRRSTREAVKSCISRTLSLARCWRPDARSQYARWSGRA